MSNVENFYPADAAKEPDNVLEQSIGQFSEVLIIGWDKDGNFDARATLGLSDGGDVNWLIDVFKHKLLSGDFAGDE